MPIVSAGEKIYNLYNFYYFWGNFLNLFPLRRGVERFSDFPLAKPRVKIVFMKGCRKAPYTCSIDKILIYVGWLCIVGLCILRKKWQKLQGRLVQHQRQKIMEYYEKKEKQVELQRKIQRSNMQNQGRLRCLKAREDHLRNVLDEAQASLSRISNEPKNYPSILKGLILQVGCRLVGNSWNMQVFRKKKRKKSRKFQNMCIESTKKSFLI